MPLNPSPWPASVVYVRHMRSEGNDRTVDERAKYEKPTHMYDIVPSGMAHGEATREYLQRVYPENHFDAYFHSTYLRAKRTLEVIAPNAPREDIYEDSRLNEADRGIFHVMNHEQANLVFPGELARMNRIEFYHYRALGGENDTDVEQRLWSWLMWVKMTLANKNILVVSHGGAQISLDKILLGHSWKDSRDRLVRGEHMANAAITIYKPNAESTHMERVAFNLKPWEL